MISTDMPIVNKFPYSFHSLSSYVAYFNRFKKTCNKTTKTSSFILFVIQTDGGLFFFDDQFGERGGLRGILVCHGEFLYTVKTLTIRLFTVIFIFLHILSP